MMPVVPEQTRRLSRFIWLAVLPFFWGCTKNHGVPAVALDYQGLKRISDFDIYEVKFSSNIDFFNIFEPGKRPISSILRCSLGVDEVSVDHNVNQYSASGLVSVSQPTRNGEFLVYSSALSFYENMNGVRSRRTLNADELQRILQDKQFVPCVYTATAFGFKAYRSATMRVPVADIFREVGIQ
ncbi:hypothetical protein ACPA0O_22750 [Ectopseudomonas chengduensis]|nr:hypothetical protein [Pseudomonas sp. WS 5019]NMY18475.1 hypothetical protein [Pseudomonas sp. WS 5019]